MTALATRVHESTGEASTRLKSSPVDNLVGRHRAQATVAGVANAEIAKSLSADPAAFLELHRQRGGE